MSTTRFILPLVALVAATTAAAEPVPAKARTLAAEGLQAHAAGDYRRAIDAFERAYVLAPSGNLIFNLAQAYRLAGDCENALIMYRRFLLSGPTVEAANLAGVHLRAMERCVVQLETIPMVPLRPRPIPPSPTPTPTPTRTPTPTPTPTMVTRTPTLTHPPIVIGLAATGVAALGVGLVYALDARAASRDVEALYARGSAWTDIADTDARGKRDTRLSIGFGIGGLLAVGGAIGLHLYDRHAAERATISVAQNSHTGGAQVRVGWSF
ncbi:MAG: hypothetical protein NT062_13615 [Proteobacteria bacterium]|nr:hypothetical protein [Pseudomonadota bacterium]